MPYSIYLFFHPTILDDDDDDDDFIPFAVCCVPSSLSVLHYLESLSIVYIYVMYVYIYIYIM